MQCLDTEQGNRLIHYLKPNHQRRNQKMNNVQLVGRVAVEPKLRTTTKGKADMRLVIAVHGYWDRKAKEMTTDFIPVKFWAQETTRCQHLVKGSLIAVTGRVAVSQYPAKNGHEIEYVTEIIGESVQFLAKPKSAMETTAKSAGNHAKKAVAR